MPVPGSTGFSGLSKATTAKPAAPAAKPPSLLDQAKADVKAKATPPAKSRAELLREQAAAAEAEEAAAAAAQGIEPEVIEPEIEAPPTKVAPKAAAAKPVQANAVALPRSGGGFALATHDRKAMANALLAFVEVAETKKVPSLFPTLVCSGGEQGGLWVSPDWQHEDVAAILPQGKKPLKAFYLGYRMDVTIWPKEYDKTNPGKIKPCNAGVISCDNVQLSKLATQAVKNYQFTKKVQKAKFDLDARGNGAGRPSVAVEVIVYLVDTDAKGNVVPDSGKIAVLRTISGYGPSARTMGSLAAMIDPETQEIANVPMTVKIDTIDESSNSEKWPCHFFVFSTDATSTGKAVFDAFEAYKAAAMEDAEFMAKFSDWLTGADRPMTEDTANRLKLAASL